MQRGLIRLSAVLLSLLLMIVMLPERPKYEEIRVTAENEVPDAVDIHIRSAVARDQGNGTYSVEVVFTTDMAGELEGMRSVTVFGDAQQHSFFLDGDNLEEVHTVCFTESEQPERIRVEVRFHRTEEGLLLMQEGEGVLCGEAEHPVDGDRFLRLSGGVPGEICGLYRVADLSEWLSGTVVLNWPPSVKERAQYAIRQRYAATVSLDKHGSGVLNFTREGLEDGLYLLEYGKMAMYICIPAVEASGTLCSSWVDVVLNENLKIQQDAQKIGELY